MTARLLRWWCINFHNYSALSRPVRNEYVCFICHERYAVKWDEPGPSREAAPVLSEASHAR